MNISLSWSTTQKSIMQSSPVQTDATLLANNSQHRWMLPVASTGVASFSISTRPGWLSFPHILKIARMINPRCAPQHFELLSFLAHPTTHNLLPAVDWSNKKFVGPGLQVYGLATPLGSVCTPCSMFLAVVGSYCAKFETDQTFSYVHWRKKTPTISGVVDLTKMWWSTFKSVQHRFASLQLVCRLRVVACRLFSRGVIFTRARVFLALLSLRKNGGLLVAYSCVNRGCILHGFHAGANAILYRGVD